MCWSWYKLLLNYWTALLVTELILTYRLLSTGVSDEDIANVTLPTGIPVLLELDENLRPVKPRQLLGDQAKIQAAIKKVEDQGKAKPSTWIGGTVYKTQHSSALLDLKELLDGGRWKAQWTDGFCLNDRTRRYSYCLCGCGAERWDGFSESREELHHVTAQCWAGL